MMRSILTLALALVCVAASHAQPSSTFTMFEVVANAGGPLASPESGAAAFRNFPTPGGENPSANQQTIDTRWLISTFGYGEFAEFEERVLRDDNATRAAPDAYEVRFTGTSTAYRGFQDEGGFVTVPFEIWNIGPNTPGDPSDDYRMIPYIFDIDLDGTFNLSTADSPISGAPNDPETDLVYWYDPVTIAAGEQGYLDWEANAATAPEAVGGEVIARMTFVAWNMGAAPPYLAQYPESGTIFRMTTSTPTESAGEEAVSAEALSLSIHPNPMRSRSAVRLALATAEEVRVRVLDVQGREVAMLATGLQASGESVFALPSNLPAGVYAVEAIAGDQRLTRLVTVIR